MKNINMNQVEVMLEVVDVINIFLNPREMYTSYSILQWQSEHTNSHL